MNEKKKKKRSKDEQFCLNFDASEDIICASHLTIKKSSLPLLLGK